jgi:pyruvate-formate lyase-activating enzyme
MNTVNIVFKSLYACAHQCGFCHVLHVPRNVSYMSTEAVKSAFDDIEKIFAGSRIEMEMSGGEFTMRNDAVDLVRYVRAKRIRWSSLVLDTMGVFLAEEQLARSLGALFDKANVSVHACDAELHTRTSGSRTKFDQLEEGLQNVFRFFPAVFTNTSISRDSCGRLEEIAQFILRARRAAPDRPLYCLFYIPVFREYGAAGKENQFRIQGQNNADFVPAPSALESLRAEFARVRSLLAAHGVPAILRDFNLPACVFHRVTGGFPENAFALPNFIAGSYFIDYAHPARERHTLEAVYPSMHCRTKPAACGACVVKDVCPGMPEAWLARGYTAAPIDERQYAAAFPAQLLNRTLFDLFHDAVRMKQLLAALPIDWHELMQAYFERLRGDAADLRNARGRIAQLGAAARAEALIEHLAERRDSAAGILARALAKELAAAQHA